VPIARGGDLDAKVLLNAPGLWEIDRGSVCNGALTSSPTLHSWDSALAGRQTASYSPARQRRYNSVSSSTASG
jgi:hypothetical protein